VKSCSSLWKIFESMCSKARSLSAFQNGSLTKLFPSGSFCCSAVLPDLPSRITHRRKV